MKLNQQPVVCINQLLAQAQIVKTCRDKHTYRGRQLRAVTLAKLAKVEGLRSLLNQEQPELAASAMSL